MAPERGGPLAAALSVIAALAAGAVVLRALGVDPLDYYALVARDGLLSRLGWQETVTRSGPLMLLGAALIVSFRAGVWNLGVDGQFVLGAVISAAVAPWLDPILPMWLMTVISLAAAMAAALAWALLPAALRAWQGVNEVVSTLMMNFLGLSLANVLIKLPFQDPATTVPMTRTLAVPHRLPHLFGGAVDAGLLIGVAALAGVHLALSGTAWGLRLRILGENPRAARHAGLRVPWLVFSTILLSAALAGLAGGVTVLGELGSVRADYDPGYGFFVVPLVFLARLNGWATMGIVVLFAGVLIGADAAAIFLQVPQNFTTVLTALLLGFSALSAWLAGRRQRRRAA
jgi:simple sugar transport system permease protein